MMIGQPTLYIVVDAPGYYGDTGRVYSAHRTLAAARRAARPGGSTVCIRESSLHRRGDVWRRHEETVYPEVSR